MLLLWWATLLWHCWLEIHAAETDHLSYYETLSHIHVSSRVKRFSPTKAELVKKVHFYVFQRDFHLTLKSGASVLAKDFRARLIHKDGSSTKVFLDQSKIFTGHDTNNAHSIVHAHLEESVWSIQIIEKDEIYAIEPAWRILTPSENPNNDSMVAYKLSDLKGCTNGRHFCNVSEKQGDETRYHNQSQSQSKVLTYLPYAAKREKRVAHSKEVCLVYLVGDADFFKGVCKSNHFSCLTLMVQRLQYADHIYRMSPFEDRYGNILLGIGVQVAELVLFTDYTSPSLLVPTRHFNEKYDWGANTKLESFARHMSITRKRYCLNHLFSGFADNGGILGLAYVDQLCHSGAGTISYNSAVTSGTNQVGFFLPSLALNLVLTHEIGHNFGAHHDPHTRECAPEPKDGGRFVMWHYTINGYFPNNRKFSSCALRKIGRSIPGSCFIERTKSYSFCGNGLIDEGEECDAGFFGSRGDNKCCSKDCTLKSSAVCSDSNHECCVNCQIASNSTPCQNTLKTYSCKNNSYCSGTSLECKDGGYQADGSTCGEQHECYDGKCLSPCEIESRRLKTFDFKSCLCKENMSEACMWCCYNATDPLRPGKCKPVLPLLRNDGTGCFKGICKGGVCHVDIIYKTRTILHAYIDFVQTSRIDELLKSNIVLLVVVVSLMFWIPISLWIESLDRKERREFDLIASKRTGVPESLRLQGKQDISTNVDDASIYSFPSDVGTSVDDKETVAERETTMSHFTRSSEVSEGGFSRKLMRSSLKSRNSIV